MSILTKQALLWQRGRHRDRDSRMESPIEVVRRFCAARSDNVEATELAAFVTDDAVYHNIPLEPISGRGVVTRIVNRMR